MNTFSKTTTTTVYSTEKLDGKKAEAFEEIKKGIEEMGESISKMGVKIASTFTSEKFEDVCGTSIEMAAVGGKVEIKGPVESLTVNGQKIELPKANAKRNPKNR